MILPFLAPLQCLLARLRGRPPEPHDAILEVRSPDRSGPYVESSMDYGSVFMGQRKRLRLRPIGGSFDGTVEARVEAVDALTNAVVAGQAAGASCTRYDGTAFDVRFTAPGAVKITLAGDKRHGPTTELIERSKIYTVAEPDPTTAELEEEDLPDEIAAAGGDAGAPAIGDPAPDQGGAAAAGDPGAAPALDPAPATA